MKRTHVITIYGRAKGGEDSRGREQRGFAVVSSGVPANLQPLTGSVQQLAAGRDVQSSWKGFIPGTYAIAEDNGVLVTEGVGPTRYIVRHVGEQGGKFDTEFMLEETDETFDAVEA